MISLYNILFQNDVDVSKSLNLLKYMNNFVSVSKKNTELIVKYHDFVNLLQDVLNYKLLYKKREKLKEEYKIAKIKEEKSNLAAKSNLIVQLADSLKKNRKKLNYFKEDYQKIKNQVNQLNLSIEHYNDKIRNMNREKKDCFSQINEITRSLEMQQTPNKKQKGLVQIEDFKKMTNSEKIRALQKKAKELGYEISQLRGTIQEIKSKKQEIYPTYDKYEKDYQKLTNLIERDQEKLESLKSELKDNLEEYSQKDLEDIEINQTSQDIKQELDSLNLQIANIEDKTYLEDDPSDLSQLSKKIEHLMSDVNNLGENSSLDVQEAEIVQSISQFRKIQQLNQKLQTFLNNFLSQINLEVNFKTFITLKLDEFYFKPTFIRSNKEEIEFEGLTTPEKVFFAISFYISLYLLTQSKTIIFSNKFIPSEFNKRGSVYRTIRKILPIFNNQKELEDIRLIFLISRLEMKNPIKNIKIINLNEEKKNGKE